MEIALILTIILQWLAIIFLAWRYNEMVKIVNAHTAILLQTCIKVCEEKEWYELAKVLKDRMDGKLNNNLSVKAESWN